MSTTENFTVKNMTKGKLPRLPFARMKETVLGIDYELSLTFVGPKKAQALNAQYRQKTYAPNVLSFPLDPASGEIVICPVTARKEAQEFGRTFENFIGFLFIHGMAHLKGMKHGSRMEKAEEKLRKKFGI